MMPAAFPDMDSLRRAASTHKFREPNEGETEEAFRAALADHVYSIDYIESLEIRNKVAWNEFSPKQNLDMMRRVGGL